MKKKEEEEEEEEEHGAKPAGKSQYGKIGLLLSCRRSAGRTDKMADSSSGFSLGIRRLHKAYAATLTAHMSSPRQGNTKRCCDNTDTKPPINQTTDLPGVGGASAGGHFLCRTDTL
ncbi:hypothetical protein INR49_022017 [Caranx melampygus]|nr:hypothetical protein INR49_022017 [Caranx melampygus]